MATTKKSTASKNTVKKTPAKPAAKKSATKSTAKTVKAPVKTAPTKAHTKVSRKKAPVVKSFHVAKSDVPFMTTRITTQTVYWAILSVIVLALGLWVIDINDQIGRIQDQIDQSIIEQQELDQKEINLVKSKLKKSND